MIDLLNTDCMTYMAALPDAAFDLAIVNPPYGINATKFSMGQNLNRNDGCEIDADYWRAAMERFETKTRQIDLLGFTPNPRQEGAS